MQGRFHSLKAPFLIYNHLMIPDCKIFQKIQLHHSTNNYIAKPSANDTCLTSTKSFTIHFEIRD
ncbi:MAG TPA: hypothetical protein DCS30_07590 [Rhizobiales bacterium]|nr:hypothetical protein [Hyphomicrobiales bacterium]